VSVRATKSATSFAPGRPPALLAFISVVSAVGLGVIAHSVQAAVLAPPPFAWLLIGVAAIVTGSFTLKIPNVPIYLSLADTFFITCAVLFGPAAATVTIAIDSLIVSWRRRSAIDQLLFNTATSSISIWAAAHAFGAIGRSGLPSSAFASPELQMMVAMAGLTAVYFLINSSLVATAVALQEHIPLLKIWKQYFVVIGVSHFAAASGSCFFVVVLRDVSPFFIAGFIPLVAIFYVAVHSWLGRIADMDRHVETVNRLYLSTATALSISIEAKDGVTSDHIHRVQVYARALAQGLHLTDESELKAIEMAALLHDVGKIAIPEQILNKPGELDLAEYEVMKTHVDVGADILSSIDFPYPVIPIVRAHHERWDGSGYPAGLHGEEIPIGARILSVVDCFDALTSERPYRSAIGEDEALALIVTLRGTAYDPDVVDAFVRVCPTVVVADPEPRLQRAVKHIRRLRSESPTSKSRRNPEIDRPTGGFASVSRLVLGRASLDDIGALAWDQIQPLAAGAGMVLFTVDSRLSALVAVHAEGPLSVCAAGLTIGIGERVSGWAAAHRQTLANSDARLDLPHDAPPDLRFAVAVPIITDEKLAGLIAMYGPRRFSDRFVRMVEDIASHLGILIGATLPDRRPAKARRPKIRDEAVFDAPRILRDREADFL